MTGGRLATHAVLLLTALVVPRVLGAASYGRFGAAMAVVQILLTASGAGLALVEMRFLAPLWRSQDREAALDLASTLWSTRLLLSAAAAALAFVWFVLARSLDFGPLLCALLALFCFGRCATEATRSLFLSLGRVGPMMGLELLRVSLTLPVVVAGFAAAGLFGAFASLPAVYVLLLVLAVAWLQRIAPLHPTRFRWSTLRPHVGYSLSTFVGTVAGIVQSQFAVFAVASWVAPREAGYLAFAVQLFALAQGLFIAGRRALTPLLSELEAEGDRARLTHWGELMMRYAVAALAVATVCWALLGGALVDWALTPAFAPAHACGTWMLAGALFFCGGGSANGLLYVRGHARTASTNLVLYAAATLVGLVLVLAERETGGAALRIATVYALASFLFFGVSVTALRRIGRVQLPIGRSALLIAPVALAWPASAWSAGPAERAVALAVFVAAYLGAAVAGGLLPAREMREIAVRLRG